MKQLLLQVDCDGCEVNKLGQGPQSSDVRYVILPTIYQGLILQVKMDIVKSRESPKVSKE
jgi:hypothetical protein